MSKTLEGMVREYKAALAADHKEALLQGRDHDKSAAMGAALLFLAANVTDEMVEAAVRGALNSRSATQLDRDRDGLSAALLAAAEGE